MLENEAFIEAINNAEANASAKLQRYLNAISLNAENISPQLNSPTQQCSAVFELIDLELFSDNVKTASGKIQDLLKLEQKPNPTEFAKNILKSMLPTFLLFSDEDRQLEYQYPVAKLNSPTKLLTTLSGLAELNLGLLSQAITNNDSARIRRLLRIANGNLQTIFDGKWSQSDLKVELDVNNQALEILFDEGEDNFTELKLRSDGFKQFLALVSLASSLKESNVILLIDEMELHLHYDGQADLLQTLAKQNFAKKVVYSTHSIGCLPEDLGGIKVVERVDNGFTSKIENKFWNLGNSFMPLLSKIGAEQLAFLPLRNAVIVEGPMDMLLLPLIFKEAINEDYVGFLIVHGLSEQSLKQISHFERNGSEVAYLTDCDEEGGKLQRQLKANKVEDSKIFNLPGKIGNEVVRLEELLTEESLARAFNSLLKLYKPDEIEIEIADISPDDKLGSLMEIAKNRSMSESDIKVPLAYEILLLVAEDPTIKIIEAEHLDGIRTLHQGILDSMRPE